MISANQVVHLEGVTRTFHVVERTTGFVATVKNFVHRRYKSIAAIQDINLTANTGEILGILGANGSGKTTTLKCVSGLLTPSKGEIDVLGFIPHERSVNFLRQIAFVMGQRSQLHQDVCVLDSFELRRVVYGLELAAYASSRDELVDLLDLASFADTPVRQLSLGQRMRCELAAALLHRPRLVLLDEPTIGLDFEAQNAIRAFVRNYVNEHEATVLLTSHYLQDIEALADRVAVLAAGRLVFNGSLQDLRSLKSDRQVLSLYGDDIDLTAAPWASLIACDLPGEINIEVPKREAPAILAQLSALPGVRGLTLADPPLEAALRDLYARTEEIKHDPSS
ncbi:MAG: ATP-binding cassette domain-containing protein [Propionibacteriaceae bacterium]|nr:ATP-binding cassette domain-containing protein [Propionibacteriaceae bacterium]